MKRKPKELEVIKYNCKGDMYAIGSDYMVVNDYLICFKKKNMLPFKNDEINKIKQYLDYCIENNLKITI